MEAASFDPQQAISIVVYNTFPLNCMDSPLKKTQGETRSIAKADRLCIFRLFFDAFQMNLLATGIMLRH